MELLFATANKYKIKEAQAIVGSRFTIISPADLFFADEIPETGDTLEENALQKAGHIWSVFQRPCFADDTGLEIEALGGAPGIYSARYAGASRDFKKNMLKVLEQMRFHTNRAARFRCVVAYRDAEGARCFEGRVEGDLLTGFRGEGGFGYDPIFVPRGYTQSFAEMPAEEKNRISHRRQAIEKLARFLNARP